MSGASATPEREEHSTQGPTTTLLDQGEQQRDPITTPRLELCARWAGTCCGRGGCRAGVSAPAALVARGVV